MSGFLWCHLERRYSARWASTFAPRLIAWACACWSFATALSGFAGSYLTRLAARASVGVGEAHTSLLAPQPALIMFPLHLVSVGHVSFCAYRWVSCLVYVVGGLCDKHYGCACVLRRRRFPLAAGSTVSAVREPPAWCRITRAASAGSAQLCRDGGRRTQRARRNPVRGRLREPLRKERGCPMATSCATSPIADDSGICLLHLAVAPRGLMPSVSARRVFARPRRPSASEPSGYHRFHRDFRGGGGGTTVRSITAGLSLGCPRFGYPGLPLPSCGWLSRTNSHTITLCGWGLAHCVSSCRPAPSLPHRHLVSPPTSYGRSPWSPPPSISRRRSLAASHRALSDRFSWAQSVKNCAHPVVIGGCIMGLGGRVAQARVSGAGAGDA